MADIPVRVIIEAIDNATDKITKTASGIGKLTDEQKKLAIGLVALGTAASVMGKQFVDAAGFMEQSNIAFETMIGNATVAHKLLADLSDFAKKTPFNLPELIDGSKRLLAYNVSAEKIIPTMEMLGNIASGVGKEKLPQLILAFGQVKAATKLTGMELRQFSEAGVPLLQALVDQANSTGGALVKVGTKSKTSAADVKELNDKLSIASQRLKEAEGNAKTKASTLMSLKNTVENYTLKLAEANGEMAKGGTHMVKMKMTAADMIKQVSDGTITFEQVQKALAGMTGDGGKFFNLMDKQSQTTLGKISNLEDGLFRLKAALGDALLPGLNKLLDATLPFLEKMAEWAKNNPEWVARIIVLALALGALGSAMLILNPIIMGAVGAFQLVAAIAGPVISAIGFIVGILGGPLTLILLAVAAVIGFLVVAWKKNWFDIQGKTAAVIDAIKGFVTSLVEKFNAFVAFIVNIPAMVQGAWEAFKAMLAKFFIEDIPYAIGWLVGRFVRFVTEDVPNFITGVVNWFATLPGRIEAWLKDLGQKIHDRWEQFKKDAIEKTVAMVDGVVAWIGKLPKQIDDFVKQIPKTIEEWFNKAKDIAIKIAMDLFYGVSGWIGQVIKLFAGIIDKANEAIDKSNKAMSLGMKSGSGQRQFGGPVSSASPVLVGERGPEMFVPQTAGRIIPNNQISGTKSGATIQFIINANTIVNSPTERRSLAEALYKDLVSLARAQNRTVAEVFGG